MLTKKKIKEQIESIRDPLLFTAFQFEGHAIEEHVLSDDKLRWKLWKKKAPVDNDDIVMVTRFFSKESALNLIANALLKNLDEIVKWLLSDTNRVFVATATFEEPTGDGLTKNTDWTKTIPVHDVRVIIKKDFRIISRSFSIITAYPQRSFEDVDVIYEAIDEYTSRKEK